MRGQALDTLRLENLGKSFSSVTAVHGVSLSIRPGEMVSVIGRSGAGKSTLLKLINRLSEPSWGRIFYGERNVTALAGSELFDWRSRCAMIFQGFHLSGRLDVATNVLIGRLRRTSTLRSLIGWFCDDDRLRAARVLEQVGLLDRALDRADRLSGGQMQRVAIARALVQEPAILLADEPISALDPESARLVMDSLQRINRSEGITVISNLHNLEAARDYSSRVIGMRDGEVVYDGEPGGLTPAAIRSIYGNSDENSATIPAA